MSRIVTSVVISVVAIMSSSLAVAEEVTGRNIAVLKPSESVELANGMTFTTLGNRLVCTMGDPNHPLHQSTGSCDGACIAVAGGENTCLGSCTWADKDGDLALFTWDGEFAGKWWFQGGTGKYAGGTGTGTWEGGGPYAGDLASHDWSGTIDLQ